MRCGDKRLGVCGLLAALWSCEGAKAPDKTAERVLEAIPQAEISTDPNVLAPFVGWALNQAVPSLRYWNIMNVEAALDFVGGEPGPPVLFAGLPLGASHLSQAPVRVPRRQDENPCPARMDRSETPTGKIDLELLGGCESTVGGFPVRYDGRIRLEGNFGLSALRVDYEWTRWKEETPFGSRTVSGTQTMDSAFQPGGEYSVSIRRELRGTTGTAESLAEVFTWNVSGQDGEEASTTGSWLLASGSSTSALRADLRATAAASEKTPGTIPPVTEGTLEIGLVFGAPLSLFSGSSSGRLIVRLESVRRHDCGAGGAEPTAGRLILESLNAVEINFVDVCDGCGLLADGRKVCWAEAAPEVKPGGAPTEPPPEPVASEPEVPPGPPLPTVEPLFDADPEIEPRQVTLPSQDVAVALPEGYRTVNVEGDVSGIFFDRSEGVRGLAVASAVEAGSLAIKLGDALKKGVRVNGTSLPAETTATVSTVNSLRLTSVDGKPMTLQTFSLGFPAPRAWESVTAQIAAAVGAPGKTDVSMRGLDLGSASSVSSKEYVAMVGSVPRESGKSLHAAAVVPLESFDERSVEMFQAVGAATRANARLLKKEETFVAQAQGPQINVSSSIVDVLWVIDDSGSMSEEQTNLATNFDAFFRQFRALNLDYHLGVVTSDCDNTGGSSSSYSSYKSKALCGTLRKLSNGAVYIDPNTPQAETEWATISRPGTSGSGNEKPLLASREALTSRVTDKTNAGFRRADASLVVILVTDEVDQSYEGAYSNSRLGSTYTPYTPPAPFTQFMQTQGAAVFAITGDPADSYSTGGCSSINGSAEPGNAVIEVAESSGGSWASICSSTFAPTLSLLSQAIGTRSSRFKLSQPAIPSRIRVFVDGIEVRRSLTQKAGSALQTQDGFVYDIVSRTISFAGTRFTPKPGQTVRVVYLVVEGST